MITIQELEKIVKYKYEEAILFCENAVLYYERCLSLENYKIEDNFFIPFTRGGASNRKNKYHEKLCILKDNLKFIPIWFSQQIKNENQIIFNHTENYDEYGRFGIQIKKVDNKILYDFFDGTENIYYDEKVDFIDDDFIELTEEKVIDFIYINECSDLDLSFFSQENILHSDHKLYGFFYTKPKEYI